MNWRMRRRVSYGRRGTVEGEEEEDDELDGFREEGGEAGREVWPEGCSGREELEKD
jgi:hypothetical protein